MIKRGILLILLLSFLFLAGCAIEETTKPATVVCNAPYIRHADDCCLDQNSNKICDSDESTAEPVQEPATKEELAEVLSESRTVQSCEINADLECVSAKINESGIEIEIKNNLQNKILFHRIGFGGTCTKPFEIFIESGEAKKLFMDCFINDDISRIYFVVSYDDYGIEQNKEETGKIVLG